MTNYDVDSIPAEARLFSTFEVAKAAGLHPAQINALARKYGVLYSIVNVNGNRKARFTYESMRRLVLIAKTAPKKRDELQFNDVENEHPLVTDKRCLNLSYWPDVVPVCFEEVD